MEITLNTKKIDYQTAVEILNSNNPGTYNICGPNLISKGDTIYTYAGIKIDNTLYSEYEITPENYNNFITNVEKTNGNIKFYLIPPITRSGDKYTLTTNKDIKDSITLYYEYNTYNTSDNKITPITCEKQFTDTESINLSTTTDLQGNYKYDIYYNIKTCSCTTTKEEEINIQSQHQIYDNITTPYCTLNINYTTIANQYNCLYNHYITCAPLTTEGKDFTTLFNKSKNCWVNKSDINCVIDYNKFISESYKNSHLGCVNLKAIAPNIFCKINHCIYSYLGYVDTSDDQKAIYNYNCIEYTKQTNIINNCPFLILKPLEFKTDSDCIYICPIKIYCFTYNDSCNLTSLCNYTSSLPNLQIKIHGIKQFNSDVIKFCCDNNNACYVHNSCGCFPIHITDYCTESSPTDTNPWEFYYTIQTENGPIESPHLLIWRKETTDEDNITTYSIGCKSYY